MIDTLKGRAKEKASIIAIKKTIVHKDTPLRIDRKTVIFISKSDDPEKKKAEFIEKIEKSRNNQTGF